MKFICAYHIIVAIIKILQISFHLFHHFLHKYFNTSPRHLSIPLKLKEISFFIMALLYLYK